MTTDARAAALRTAFGFSPRQAQFLTLVSLMSGYFQRRHYCAWAQIKEGKNARAFFADLVTRALVTARRPRADRGWLYHLRARPVYDVLELHDNRNRRTASPARQARRLMLLDVAISLRDVRWFATEADKVELFTRHLALPLELLPLRVYSGADGNTTTRRFIHKLPIYQTEDGVIHFVVLALDTTGQTLATFLADHAALLARLPHWHLIVAFPRLFRAGESAWRRALKDAPVLGMPTISPADARELHHYFRVQHALRVGSASPITIDRDHEQRRRRFAHRFDAFYDSWRAGGGPERPVDAPPDFTMRRPAGAFSFYELPYTYDLFGQFPGIV